MLLSNISVCEHADTHRGMHAGLKRFMVDTSGERFKTYVYIFSLAIIFYFIIFLYLFLINFDFKTIKAIFINEEEL